MESKSFIPYSLPAYSQEEMISRSLEWYTFMENRRSVRHFSSKPVSKSIIENLIRTASAAPSGAHKQPWTFCAVSNPDIKQKIREAAEKEEFENYHGRMSEEWLKDLEKFDTHWVKDFLTTAPWLIVLFRKSYDIHEKGEKTKNYYVQESVGIAAGFLITAIHQAGLTTLTHTPSPMAFLQDILQRPENEKPFLLLPVGFPAEDCLVPSLTRKSLTEIAVFYE
jgi:iodotyrosine deiodinase